MSIQPSVDQELIEQLVASCLEHLPEEGEAVVASVCRDHPEHVATVKKLLGSLGRVGLIEADAAPEQLRPDVIGGYRLLERIGKGGMGEVYLAEQQSPQRRVALKLLRSGHQMFTRSRERFRREVDVIAQLDHPGICPLFDAGEAEGVPYLAMRFVEGETLAQRIAREATRSGAQVETARASESSGREVTLATTLLIEKVARALHYAHEKGLVHRDVKPGNIMVTPDGEPMLLDFGLALTDQDGTSNLTLSGDQVGTPAYMSPEQVMGNRDIDRRTDVYSLGATLYEALTLRCPHEAPTRDALYRQIVGGSEIARASSNNRAIPRDLEIVIETALDRDANRRYATALAFADDLRRVREHRPIAARPIGAVLRLRRWAQRRPAMATGLVTAFVLLLAGLVLALVVNDGLERVNRTTRALGLAGAALEAIRSDPTLATLLALEAMDLENRVETRSALHRALMLSYEQLVIRPQGVLTKAAALPDASLFVTGTEDGTLELWDRNGRSLWSTSRGDAATQDTDTQDTARIEQVWFLGSDRIVAANARGQARLFDLEGKELDCFVAEPRRPWRGSRGVSVTEQGTHIVLCSDETCQLLELTGDARDELRRTQDLPVAGANACIAFDPTGRWLAIAPHRQPVARIWRRRDSRTYEEVEPVALAHGVVRSLAYSGSRLLVGVSGAPNVRIDLETRERTEFGEQTQTAVPLERGRILGTRQDGRFTIWDAALQVEVSPRTPGALDAPLTPLPAVPSPDGSRFAVSYQDGSIRVFDSRGDLRLNLIGHMTIAGTFAFLRGGEELFSSAPGDAVRLWRLQDPDLLQESDKPALPIRYAPDGRHLLMPSAGFTLWNCGARLAPVLRTEINNGWAWPFFPFSSDGARFAIVHNPALRVFDTTSGDEVAKLVDEQQRHGAFCVLPHSTSILRFPLDSPPWAGTVFDFANDTVTAGPEVESKVIAVAPAPSGRSVVLALFTARLQRYDLEPGGTWRLVAECATSARSRTIEFSPDGERVLAGTDDARILAFTGDLVPCEKPFVGHRLLVNGIRHSPDGSVVASTSMDGTARLWRPDGTEIAVLDVPSGAVWGGDFTPDGKRFVTSHKDGTIRRWFVDSTDLRAVAVARLSRREFTATERQRFAALLGR